MSNSFDKILFNKPNGSIFKQTLFRPVSGDSSSNQESLIRSAGVMTVGYIPVIGDCDYDGRYGIGSSTKVSPFNAALSKLYIKLKGKAMTLGNYSAADVGKGLLALDSLYGLLAELDVDITSLSEYCYDNVAKRGMIQEVLWRYPAVAQANIANLIARRNNIANKMNALPFIPGIKFMQDHIDWAKYVYKDDNLDKSALILFRRTGYYRWCCRPTDTHPGTLILSDNTSGSAYTMINYSIIKAEDKFDILEMLLKDYTLDDDFTDLCAGIANAYGVDKDSYAIPTLPSDLTKFRLETKYDLDVIDSLRSADFSILMASNGSIEGIDETSDGHLAYTNDFNYAPDGEFRVPAFATMNTSPNQYKSPDTGDGRILFSYEDNPTADAIDVTARYVHDYVHYNTTENYSRVFGLKSEYLTGISIWYMDENRSFIHIDIYRFLDSGVPNSAPHRMSTEAEGIAGSLISLPMLYYLYLDGNGNYLGNKPWTSKKDIDNLGILPRYANSTLSEEYMWNKFFPTNKQRFGKKDASKKKSKEESPIE